MTAAEFDALSRETHRRLDDLFLRAGRLAGSVDALRDQVRMLRIMTDVEMDIAEIEG